MMQCARHLSRAPTISTSLFLHRSLSNKSFDDPDKPPTDYEKRLAADKGKLKWRTPYFERKDEWKSKFTIFAPKSESMDMLTVLQKPIDLSFKRWKERREEKRVKIEKFMQQFIPERHQILGNDLATAHFIIHRGGQIKFKNIDKWIKLDDEQIFDLPSVYHPEYLVEAVRCDGMELYYEGLENIRRLNELKFLSFRGIKAFDDWYIDRVSGLQCDNLEVLDVSGTNITERGLCALYRMPSLKMLYIDKPTNSVSFELTCEMLYDILPNLKICSSNVPIVKW